MIAVDFFCGAGGLTRGLLNAGIDVVLGIDADEGCRETYETNNPDSHFLPADVRQLTVEQIRNLIPNVNRDDLLFAACAPCQPFAQLNRGEKANWASAATLLGRFARFVRELQPRQILIENVPGLTKVGGSSTYNRFRRMLHTLGYEYIEGFLDAKQYGVPQNRRRFVLLAIRELRPTFPDPTHGPMLIPYETVENAIISYPPLNAGETHPDVPNHRAAIISDINLERLRHTPHNGGNRTAWPEYLWLQCHRNGYEGHTDTYGRMYWQRPAPALTCRCHSISNGRYGHPVQDRAISLREAAKLQSFEDHYVFYGNSLAHLASQIGNAVPVRMAEVVGGHIRRLTGEE